MNEMMRFPDSMRFSEDEIRYEDPISRREERWVPCKRANGLTFWKRIVVGEEGTIEENEKLFLVKVKIHVCVQDTRTRLARLVSRREKHQATYGELNIPIGRKKAIRVQRLSRRAKDGVAAWAGNDVKAEEEARRIYDDAESIESLGDFVLVAFSEPPTIEESMPVEQQIAMHPNPQRIGTSIQLNIGAPGAPTTRSATIGTDTADTIESRPLTPEEQLHGRYVVVHNMYVGLKDMTIHIARFGTEGFIDESNSIISIVVERINETEFALETRYEGRTYRTILKEDGTIDGELPSIAVTALTPTWKQIRIPTVTRREDGTTRSAKREPDVMYFRKENDLIVTKSGHLLDGPQPEQSTAEGQRPQITIGPSAKKQPMGPKLSLVQEYQDRDPALEQWMLQPFHWGINTFVSSGFSDMNGLQIAADSLSVDKAQFSRALQKLQSLTANIRRDGTDMFRLASLLNDEWCVRNGYFLPVQMTGVDATTSAYWLAIDRIDSTQQVDSEFGAIPIHNVTRLYPIDKRHPDACRYGQDCLLMYEESIKEDARRTFVAGQPGSKAIITHPLGQGAAEASRQYYKEAWELLGGQQHIADALRINALCEEVRHGIDTKKAIASPEGRLITQEDCQQCLRQCLVNDEILFQAIGGSNLPPNPIHAMALTSGVMEWAGQASSAAEGYDPRLTLTFWKKLLSYSAIRCRGLSIRQSLEQNHSDPHELGTGINMWLLSNQEGMCRQEFSLDVPIPHRELINNTDILRTRMTPAQLRLAIKQMTSPHLQHQIDAPPFPLINDKGELEHHV